MNCRHCSKPFEDEITRYVWLNKFVQSRRERACFDYACLNCGKQAALKERNARRERYSLEEEPTISVGPFRFGSGGGEWVIRSGKERS